jgi:hypothetical protein
VSLKLLPFVLKEGQLLHISDVEKGLNCECVCPSCGHPLVARKGEKIIHHFAHHKGKECEYGLETTLHLAAKEILAEHKRIILPEVKLDMNDHSNRWIISKEKEIGFDEVILESYQNGVIPDVLVYVNGKPLMIEITVTHKTDEEKIQKVRKRGISILEIDLSRYKRDISYEELEKEIIHTTHNKNWLTNQLINRTKNMVEQLSDKKVCDRQGPKRCPKFIKGYSGGGGRGYRQISWLNDCQYCEFFTGLEYGEEREDRYWRYTEVTVSCIGRYKIDSYEKLKKHLKK